MNTRLIAVTLSLTAAALLVLGIGSSRSEESQTEVSASSLTRQDQAILRHSEQMLERGRRIFRYDTFGDEVFWGNTLKLHRAIAGKTLGGVGPGLSPRAALALGLKVDREALPESVRSALKRGEIDLDDPATTLALLEMRAVVGITGRFDAQGRLKSIGVQCALCHSTVDDSFAPGIGRRLDGWANRDLNVGAIIALSPGLDAIANVLGLPTPQVRQVLKSWGPGKFDAQLLLDGKAVRPDGRSAATLIPPAFGLAGVNLHTWTGGWGSVPYWNAFVANIEMGGQGIFWDPRLNDASKYPIAARSGVGNIRSDVDRITPKLAALQFYQLAIPAPRPKAGSFDVAAAARGRALFNDRAKCSTCHVPPLFTEPGWNVHTAEEIGIDDFQAKRSPDGTYRTAPLRGLMSHAKGGFYHDGRFPNLRAVINHYDTFFALGLSDPEKRDLIEYLKSL